jgi:UDP:flavonoid glycosyltransferase YjiC (YdhE family)
MREGITARSPTMTGAKKILIVWELGGNLGHLARLLPIAQKLSRDGHQVVFAMPDPIVADQFVTPAGFAWVQAPRVVQETQHTSSPINFYEVLLRTSFSVPDKALACIQAWQTLFSVVRPDAVLIDASPLALYAARTYRLHAIALGHGFEIPLVGQAQPCFTPWLPDASELAVAAQRRLDQSLGDIADGVAAPYRGSAPRSLDDLFSVKHTALCNWPELDHFDRDTSQASAYCGPIWSEPQSAISREWPQRTGAKVLCYLNLKDKRYDLLWQALVQHNANVWVISPAGNPKACESARGWGITVTEHPIRLTAPLEFSDAVIGHAGMGFTSMCLQHGKPLMLLPETLEQVILTYRLAKQGLALGTVRHNAKHTMASKVQALLTGATLFSNAQAFAKKYEYHSCLSVVAKAAELLISHEG